MKHSSHAFWSLVIVLPILALLLGWAVRHRLAKVDDSRAVNNGGYFVRASLETYHDDYRRTSSFDPGSLRVFLRNREAQPIRITSVLLDDFPIPVWGLTTSLTASVANTEAFDPASGTNGLHLPERSGLGISHRIHQKMGHRQILWARLRPSVIQPGAIAECVVKLQNPMTRPMKLSFALDDAPVHDVVFRPAARRLAISSVTFSPDCGVMHVFVCNNGTVTDELTRCELDGVDLGVEARISPRSIAPGMKSVVSIQPPHLFSQGAFHTLRVTTRNGATTAERVRVFAGFPLATEGRAHAARGFGLDEWHCTPPPDGTCSPRPPGPWINVIFECVMHKYRADLTRTAQQVFHLYDDMLAVDPFHPSIIHPCRIRVEEGCAKFGETADAIRINPFVGRDDPDGGPPLAPHESVWRLGELASVGAAPRPWYALIATGEPGCDSPHALRRLGYAAVASGAKGLFFRHADWKRTAAGDFNRELRSWIAEIAQIRSWLAVADVVPALASVTPASLTAATLLTPDRGLVLIIVNGASDLPEGSRAEIGILWPFGAMPGRLSQVTAGGLQEVHIFEPTEAGRMNMDIPVPKDATTYVLACERIQP